ncbi:MAG: hypothetical protein ABIF71_07090 [Planctomycetota bacterium]
MSPCLLIFAGGLAVAVFQVALIRELLITLKGNELHIGLITLVWLMAAGAGSLAGAAMRGAAPVRWAVNLAAIAAAIAGPAGFLVARGAAMVFPLPGYAAGPGLALAVIALVTVLPALCINGLTGMLMAREEGRTVARLYLWEAAGVAAGGILFSLVMAPLGMITAGVVLASVLLLSVLVIWNRPGRAVCAVAIIGLGLVVIATALNRDRFDRWSKSLRNGRQASVPADQRSTPYGDIDITRRGGELNVFQNGNHVGRSGGERSLEEVAAVVNLVRPEGGRLVMIGGTLTSLPEQIGRWGQWQIHLVELDPGLAGAREALGYTGQSFVADDPVRFIGDAHDACDAAVVRLDLPATLLMNRLATAEYFTRLHRMVGRNGTLFVYGARPPDFAPADYTCSLSAVFKAATGAFAFSRMTVLDTFMVWILADRPIPGPAEFRPQYPRISNAGWVSPAMIEEGFGGYAARTWDAKLGGTIIPANSIGRPSAVGAWLRYWLGIHTSGRVPAAPARGVFVLVTLGLVALAATGGWKRKGLLRAGTGAVAARLAGMAYAMIVIYLFQMVRGTLFTALGLLLACFMASMGLGAWQAVRMQWDPRKAAQWTLAGLALLGGITALTWPYIAVAWPVLFVLNACAGALAGLAFGAISRLTAFSDNRAGSVLFSLDLLGGAIGAVVVPLYLFPEAGLATACLWTACVCIIAALPFARE